MRSQLSLTFVRPSVAEDPLRKCPNALRFLRSRAALECWLEDRVLRSIVTNKV